MEQMRKAEANDLKKIQLEILSVVAAFCEQNNIRYWIDCGTLLGAVRHKGYIPWDDDIDVGMLREDYDKFSRLFSCTNNKYQFKCIELDSGFHLPHGKVLDTSTLLYEPDEKGFKFAINIDIFVYDNAPDDDLIVKEMYDRRDFLRKHFNLQTAHTKPSGNVFRKVLVYCYRLLHRFFSKDYFIKKMVANSKRFANQNTRRVGNFTSFSRMICDKRVFDSFIDVDFEGQKYKAPVGYDEWLRAFYGDYMKLPPIEKRVSHHSFVAYIEE